MSQSLCLMLTIGGENKQLRIKVKDSVQIAKTINRLNRAVSHN